MFMCYVLFGTDSTNSFFITRPEISFSKVKIIQVGTVRIVGSKMFTPGIDRFKDLLWMFPTFPCESMIVGFMSEPLLEAIV